jgi:HlyD family secretion protein
MADIRAKTSELAEKRVAAEDKLSRIDIRAPQNGVVNQLNVHTVGGVIAPPSATAEPIMLIVPEADNLTWTSCTLGDPPHCGSQHSINARRRN